MQDDKLMKTCNSKSRKAVSTIIGTFFFIIVMVGAFTAFILMMQTNSNFLNTQLGATQNEIEKIQGQFTIAAAYDASGDPGKKLCVSVKNSGSTPLEIADLFIVNKTNNVVKQFDIDFRDAFVPVSSLREILTNQPITLRPGIHDIKVVSTSGIMQTVELKVFATSSPDPRFNVTAFSYPVNAASGENVTVGIHVFNRMNTTLLNVQPVDGRPSVDPSGSVEGNKFPLVTNLTISRLDPNENALFMWEPEITGGVGSKLTFTVSAKAQVEGCTTGSSFITSEKDLTRVKVVPGVKRQILASPETFISFPNPFGDVTGTKTGVFSIVVQNPTDHTFKVNQVSIQLVNPADEDLVTAVTGVSPSTNWSEGRNIIVWKSITSPIAIRPNDMEEWIVSAQPTNIATSTPVTSIIYNTYSSFGQFGKGPFTHGVDASPTALVNVFATTPFDDTTPIFAIKDVPSGTPNQRFNFAITNNGSVAISSSSSPFAFMLINVPPGFRDVASVTETPGADGLSIGLEVKKASFLKFDDGSLQIPVKLTADLAAGSTKSYSLTATVPTISVPAFYTFTLVANGTTTNSVIIGPIAEVVVQVCPTSGTSLCP